MLQREFNLPFDISQYQNILVLGVGGGFDVVSALPIYLSLLLDNKNVALGSTNHVHLKSFYEGLGKEVYQGVLCIEPQESINGIVIESQLANRLHTNIYSFKKLGVLPLRRAIRYICDQHAIDLIIAVDGGVDALMTCKEKVQGTPIEDIATITAISGTTGVDKVLCCVGMGAEIDEGLTAEAIAPNVLELFEDGFLGVSAWVGDNEIIETTIDIYGELNKPRESHIITEIIKARVGFHNKKIKIPQVLPICWFFDLDKVVKKNILSPKIKDTFSFNEIVWTHTNMMAEKGDKDE